MLVYAILITFVLVLFNFLTHKEPAEIFIEENPITITKKTLGTDDPAGFPWYGETDESYLIMYSRLYYQIPKNNECWAFKPHHKDSWCDEETTLQCYNPEDCMVEIYTF